MTPRIVLFSHTVNGVPPRLEILSTSSCKSAGTDPPLPLHISQSLLQRLSGFCSIRQIHTAHSCLCCKFNILSFCCFTALISQTLCKLQSRLSSGVSSLRLVRAAQRIRSLLFAPPTGKKSAARRLPYVIVPVLSRHNVSTLASVSMQYSSWTRTFFFVSAS